MLNSILECFGCVRNGCGSWAVTIYIYIEKYNEKYVRESTPRCANSVSFSAAFGARGLRSVCSHAPAPCLCGETPPNPVMGYWVESLGKSKEPSLKAWEQKALLYAQSAGLPRPLTRSVTQARRLTSWFRHTRHQLYWQRHSSIHHRPYIQLARTSLNDQGLRQGSANLTAASTWSSSWQSDARADRPRSI